MKVLPGGRMGLRHAKILHNVKSSAASGLRNFDARSLHDLACCNQILPQDTRPDDHESAVGGSI